MNLWIWCFFIIDYLIACWVSVRCISLHLKEKKRNWFHLQPSFDRSVSKREVLDAAVCRLSFTSISSPTQVLASYFCSHIETKPTCIWSFKGTWSNEEQTHHSAPVWAPAGPKFSCLQVHSLGWTEHAQWQVFQTSHFLLCFLWRILFSWSLIATCWITWSSAIYKYSNVFLWLYMNITIKNGVCVCVCWYMHVQKNLKQTRSESVC